MQWHMTIILSAKVSFASTKNNATEGKVWQLCYLSFDNWSNTDINIHLLDFVSWTSKGTCWRWILWLLRDRKLKGVRRTEQDFDSSNWVSRMEENREITESGQVEFHAQAHTKELFSFKAMGDDNYSYQWCQRLFWDKNMSFQTEDPKHVIL